MLKHLIHLSYGGVETIFNRECFSTISNKFEWKGVTTLSKSSGISSCDGGEKRLSNSHTNSSVRPWCSVWREPIWCPDNPKRWMNFIEHLIWCGCSKRPLNSIQRKKIMIGSGPRSFDQLIVLRFHLANLNYVFQFRLLKPANSYSCTCKLLCNPYCLLIHVACQLRW